MDLKLEIRKGERLADQLYGQLLEKIVSGQLMEGDKLPSENEISRAFNVSRPVIRKGILKVSPRSTARQRRQFWRGERARVLVEMFCSNPLCGAIRSGFG